MLNFNNARQLLPQVWHLPDFFLDPQSLRQSYRSNQQPWRAEYPNRLLTPWGTNTEIESALAVAPAHIQDLTGCIIKTQVGYASLDLSGSQIMMHRLHPDIGAYIQVFMGTEPAQGLDTVFCLNQTKNLNHPTDYADISEFDDTELIKIKFHPNDAWLMINQPRCFFGTARPVCANSVRETLCFHFASELPANT